MPTKTSTFAPRDPQLPLARHNYPAQAFVHSPVAATQVKAKRSFLLEDEKSAIKLRLCPNEKHGNTTPTVAVSSSGKHKFFK